MKISSRISKIFEKWGFLRKFNFGSKSENFWKRTNFDSKGENFWKKKWNSAFSISKIDSFENERVNICYWNSRKLGQIFQKKKQFFWKMEIICAGYPKTGSKSCSAALRILGYNVADYIETAEYLRLNLNWIFKDSQAFRWKVKIKK